MARPEIGVIGAGAWGTSLAVLLAGKGYPVTLWARDPALVEMMSRSRENPVYLPGVAFPPSLTCTGSGVEATRGREVIVLVPPSHALRTVLTGLFPSLSPHALLVSATKGLEVDTALTMSQVIRTVLGRERRLGVLSGPSFAEEVGRSLPTAVVAASEEEAVAGEVQTLFSTPSFRVYTSPDPWGVEVAAAVKNVIAIAAGVADGLGLGFNARAALITRGLAEMTRLGVALGARPQTFAGLAGVGDLVLTCAGDLSRNRQVGVHLGQGKDVDAILGGSRSVAEGVNTSRVILTLARRAGVEMPICEQVAEILFHKKDPRAALADLLRRDLGREDD